MEGVADSKVRKRVTQTNTTEVERAKDIAAIGCKSKRFGVCNVMSKLVLFIHPGVEQK